MAQRTETHTGADGRKHEHRTAKVIEIVGSSTRSFEEAIEHALDDARATTRGITGAQVKNMSVDLSEGEVVEWKVDLKVAFAIDRTEEP